MSLLRRSASPAPLTVTPHVPSTVPPSIKHFREPGAREEALEQRQVPVSTPIFATVAQDTVRSGDATVDEIFGADGPFSKKFLNYESRDGQVRLANAVHHAMVNKQHLLGEGPCGTGKGQAYLLPAVLEAVKNKKRTIIVTANIALQEQLIEKDLPALRDVLGADYPFTYALLKGRNNYLCLDEWSANDRAVHKPLYDSVDVVRNEELRSVYDWAVNTKDGDKTFLPIVPRDDVWQLFSVMSEDCRGDACDLKEDCFANRAKNKAATADIVVTNYHLLFAHIAVRRETGEDLILPAHDYLVLDEAHEAAGIARDFFGFSVSQYAISRIAEYLRKTRTKSKTGAETERLRLLEERLSGENRSFFARLKHFHASHKDQCRIKQPAFVVPASLRSALLEARSVTKELASIDDSDDDGAEDPWEDRKNTTKEEKVAANMYKAAGRVLSRITEFCTLSDDPNKVYFIEVSQKGNARLVAKYVDVASVLEPELFGKTESVSLVSATLAAKGSFEYVRSELGVPASAEALVVESPFDFEKQALLILPDPDADTPPVDHPAFIEHAVQSFEEVIRACGGRTLGLFTSYRVLNAVHERLNAQGYTVLRQGQHSRPQLTKMFKEDTNSILLGTDSFWTGIDVPGEALTAVVIDKLPFQNLTDPVLDAIRAADRDAFMKHQLPHAIIKLRQGAGRLIRSKNDYGVVVILDRRIVEKNYAEQVIDALGMPNAELSLDAIGPFLAAHRAEQP